MLFMVKVLKYYLIFTIIFTIMIFIADKFRNFNAKNLKLLIGNGSMFVGTLGYLVQSKIQTWGDSSNPEILNKSLLVLFYIIGIGLNLIFT